MTQSRVFQTLIVILTYITLCLCHEVVELQSTNFELTLTAYKYIAILFYDDSAKGQQMVSTWDQGGLAMSETLPQDCEMAKVRFDAI